MFFNPGKTLTFTKTTFIIYNYLKLHATLLIYRVTYKVLDLKETNI